MTMHTDAHDDHRRSASNSKLEYRVYFTLIFFAALPFSTIDWVLNVIRRRTLNLRGPLARAWAEANRITPMIFSA